MRALKLSPRSLRQLVVLAFVLVLLPLLFLAYQAYQSLHNLSVKAADINRTTLTDVRRSESMTNIALEIERSYRQYCVLGDDAIKNLYKKQVKEYVRVLEAHTLVLPSSSYYQTVSASLNQLTEIRCLNGEPNAVSAKQLELFSNANALMVQVTRDVVFSRGEALQYDIAERGKFFGWQALLLFLVSLLLVVLFTRVIIGPVKGIEKMINQLGQGKILNLDHQFTGPKELRSLAQSIMWLSERLSWLESQRHEFLRHISHELKTPLASMREGTELLADEVVGILTEDQKEVVAILNTSSKHLQQLIEQLLDYNRQLSEKQIAKEKVSLPLLMEKIISAHSLPARAKSMKTECCLEVSEYWSEVELLTTVLDNLYSNAIHYGAEYGKIYIMSKHTNSSLVIDIANTGTTIPIEEQSMIFEPFYQGSHQRKGPVKGSGLGLSITRDCVHRMQGELRLVSVDYADVCFRIELPLLSEK